MKKPRIIKKYTEDYKIEAIKLALSLESISRTAKELGMRENNRAHYLEVKYFPEIS